MSLSVFLTKINIQLLSHCGHRYKLSTRLYYNERNAGTKLSRIRAETETIKDDETEKEILVWKIMILVKWWQTC